MTGVLGVDDQGVSVHIGQREEGSSQTFRYKGSDTRPRPYDEAIREAEERTRQYSDGVGVDGG